MNYARSLGLLMLMLFSVATAAAQNCPTVKVSGPYEVKSGDSLTLTVYVSGGPKEVTPTYNWTVSAGAISSGQGTSVITVDTSEVLAGSTITATVDVGGFDRECSTSNSLTSEVLAKKADARKVAEYGKIKTDEEKAVLDKYAAELVNDLSAQGYIVAYRGRQGGDKEMQAAVMRALNYLTKEKAMDGSRILNLEGGQRENLAIELWVVPQGAEAPKPTPTVEAKPAKEKPNQPSKPSGKSKKS